MPQFPRYLSQGQATTETPSFPAAESTKGQQLEEVAKVGQMAQEATFKIGQAYIEAQKTQAELNQRTQLDDLLARAEADPDYNSYEKYAQESEKITKESLSGFKNPLVRGEASAKANYYKTAADSKLKSIFRKKMIDNQQANILKLIDLEISNPSEGSLERIKSIISAQQEKGFIGAEDAYKLEKKSIKDLKRNTFTNDLQINPAEAEKKLSSNAYGFDIQELDQAHNIYEKEVDKMHAVNQLNLLSAYINDEPLDSESVRDFMNQKKIDPKFAESLIKKIENPQPDPGSKALEYIAFQNRIGDIEEQGDNADLKDVVTLMRDLMEANKKGLIDSGDMKRVMQNQDEFIQKNLGKASTEALSKAKPKTLLQHISIWSDEYAKERPEIKARMYRKLMDGTAQGENGEEVLQNLIDDEVELMMNENIVKPDIMEKWNPDTGQEIVSEDGGLTWKDKKTGKEIK